MGRLIAEPRGLRRESAAGYVGVSPSKFDEWVSDGHTFSGEVEIFLYGDPDPAIGPLHGASQFAVAKSAILPKENRTKPLFAQPDK